MEIESDIPVDFNGPSIMQGMNVKAPEVTLNGMIHAEKFICKTPICKNRGDLSAQFLQIDGQQFHHESGSIVVGSGGIALNVKELNLKAPISTSGSLWTTPLAKFDYAENVIKVDGRCSLNLANGMVLTKNIDVKGELDINIAAGNIPLENRAHLKASNININTPLTENAPPFKNSGTVESTKESVFISAAGVHQSQQGRLQAADEIYLLQSKPSNLNGSLSSQNLSLKSLNSNSAFQLANTVSVQVPGDIVIDCANGAQPEINKLGTFSLLELSNPAQFPNLSGDIQGSVSIIMDGKPHRQFPIPIQNDAHIHGELLISAPQYILALGDSGKRVQWKVEGDATFNTQGFNFQNGTMVARGDLTFNNFATNIHGQWEGLPSALLSGGKVTINSTNHIHDYYGMIYGVEGVELNTACFTRDSASQITSPQPVTIHAGQIAHSDLIQETIKLQKEEHERQKQRQIKKIKRKIKRQKRKVIIKAVAGLIIGAGAVAFLGPIMFAQGASGLTGTLAAAGKGMMFATINGVVNGQHPKELLRNVVIGAVTAGFGHFVDGLQFINALPTETAQEFVKGAINGAAGSALRRENVLLGAAAGGLNGAVTEKLGLSGSKIPAVGRTEILNEAMKGVGRGGLGAGISAVASGQVEKPGQILANMVTAGASGGVQSLATSSGNTLGVKVVKKQEAVRAAKQQAQKSAVTTNTAAAKTKTTNPSTVSTIKPKGINQTNKPAAPQGSTTQKANNQTNLSKDSNQTINNKSTASTSAKPTDKNETIKEEQFSQKSKDERPANKSSGVTESTPTKQVATNNKKEDSFSWTDLFIRPAYAETREDWMGDANSSGIKQEVKIDAERVSDNRQNAFR